MQKHKLEKISARVLDIFVKESIIRICDQNWQQPKIRRSTTKLGQDNGESLQN